MQGRDDGDQLRDLEAALDAGRPGDALALLRGTEEADDSPARLALRLRAYLEVGLVDRVLALTRALEGRDDLPPSLLQLFQGLAVQARPGTPAARAAEHLVAATALLEGPLSARGHRALARLHLETGARDRALEHLGRALEAQAEGAEAESFRLRLTLAAGRRKDALDDLAQRPLGPRDQAHLSAAAGDWTAVDILCEAQEGAFRDHPSGLEERAAFAEMLGASEVVAELLEVLERAHPGVGDPARRTYRLALAWLRTGKAERARQALADLARQEGLYPDLARALAEAGGDDVDEGEAVTLTGVPLVAWPGVHSGPAALTLALWRLGRYVDPFEVQRRVRIEGGDVLSSFELLDFLREEGLPFARFDGDEASIRRALQADLPVLVRLAVRGRGTVWAVLVGHDPRLGTFTLVSPRRGERIEVAASALREMQARVGAACLVVGGAGDGPRVQDLKLKASMALEALDRAARKSKEGDLVAAFEVLERAQGFSRDLVMFWRLRTELEVIRAISQRSEEGPLVQFLEKVTADWPDAPWPRLYHARWLIEHKGDKDRARELLREACQVCEPSAEVWTELGDLEEERGQLEAAAEAWWEAHRVDPLLSRPREQLSRHYRRVGARAVALEICESARETNPSNPYNWEMRGILLSEMGGDLEEVERSLRKALELNPSRPYAYGFLSDLFLRQGRMQEALQILEAAAGKVADPYPYLVRMSEVHFDLEHYEDTVHLAERALELRPDDPVTLGLLGAAHGRAGRLDEGIPLLQKAIAGDSADAWPVRELAIHQRSGGRLDDALATLDAGQVTLSQDVGIRVQRALTLELAGRPEDALGAARDALGLAGPQDAEVVRLVARLASDLDGLEAGLATWHQAIEAADQPAPLRKQLLSFLLDLGAYPEAEVEGREALKELPEDEEVSAWYGFAILRGGRAGEAVPWLRRALEVDPGYSFARSVLLDALTEEGLEAEAVAVYERARGVMTPLGYECAFVAYARLGQHEKALAVCRKACMAVPHAAGFFHRRAARLLLDDLCEARDARNEALAAVQEDAEDHRNHEVLAWALVALREWEAAEVAMHRMLEAGAHESDLLKFRRVLAQKRGDHQGEEACARRLAELAGDDARARRAWLVEAAVQAAYQPDGEPRVRACVAEDGLRPEEMGTLAARCVDAGRLELGREILALAGDHEGPDGLLAAGDLAARTGDLDAALELFQQLSVRYPQDHRGDEYQARVLMAQGQLDLAAAAAERAFERARAFCDTANLVYGAVRLLARDHGASHTHFRRAADLTWGDGPGLVQVMAAWSAGDPQAAEDELARLLASASASPLDLQLARRLAEAANLRLPSRPPPG